MRPAIPGMSRCLRETSLRFLLLIKICCLLCVWKMPPPPPFDDRLFFGFIQWPDSHQTLLSRVKLLKARYGLKNFRYSLSALGFGKWWVWDDPPCSALCISGTCLYLAGPCCLASLVSRPSHAAFRTGNCRRLFPSKKKKCAQKTC